MAITMADPWKITYNDFGSNGTGSYTWKYLKIDEYRVDPLIDKDGITHYTTCLLYTSPSPRDRQKSCHKNKRCRDCKLW